MHHNKLKKINIHRKITIDRLFPIYLCTTDLKFRHFDWARVAKRSQGYSSYKTSDDAQYKSPVHRMSSLTSPPKDGFTSGSFIPLVEWKSEFDIADTSQILSLFRRLSYHRLGLPAPGTTKWELKPLHHMFHFCCLLWCPLHRAADWHKLP